MENNKKDTVAKREPTLSERFVSKVQHELQGAVGTGVELSAYERQLASNLYMHIDTKLKEFEAKRLKQGNDKIKPFVWQNINIQKLSIDAAHRVRLGLDALIKNHIHPVPYHNSKTGLYDLDLQIGYKGKDYYRRKMAATPPRDVRYQLKYENDVFKALPKDSEREIESYKFEIPDPFNRGDVEGGFGYVIFEDQSLNFLVIVTEKDFKKSEARAPSKVFWGENPIEMRFKTLVLRTTERLDVDPEKVNVSYHYVEGQEIAYEETEQKQIDIPEDIPGGQEPEDAEESTGDGEQQKNEEPSAVLQYKSDIVSCKTKEEVEELRETAKKSFAEKNLKKAELSAISEACDAKLKAIK